MFSTLKQRIKYHIACFLYDAIKTRTDAQNWSQTITCTSCARIIPVDARFCAYCGIKVATFFSSTSALQLQNTDPLLFEQVTIKLPANNQPRRFLRYVRTKKDADAAGPQTRAHRQAQDYSAQPLIPEA
ncbi:zinc ribbon domain-containing protein [Dictyobacter kobayashii]|uniref:Zinc-ribbon domain-containing protein n=1 Tax=Dictyobacter kobayashii TaxID=2014872 RepID=A0A402AGV3_9CHLR|nr:zinc ribbon domain-containing protein [Dictyobacter kobayashii]GCE18319.1 hypothetical protein KDK_21190 [Dictyobacter kobayashii]